MINFRIFESPQKEILYSLAFPSHFLLSPLSPKQPLIYLLSLQICIFWTFNIKEIIQCVVFCDWLLSLTFMISRFICVVARIIPLSLFIAPKYGTEWIKHKFVYPFIT